MGFYEAPYYYKYLKIIINENIYIFVGQMKMKSVYIFMEEKEYSLRPKEDDIFLGWQENLYNFILCVKWRE